ncbi:hypothetical protein EVAR_27182_1 [Eumeta japonica]|uniref:Uncharacterized protein n=1 Tax=Eumeta variegata TaxID=151549 RepID=A0A4C1VYY2_EUMVA|nr:hypothetical protein EVAR_27182_1 [Eumeta japonica]
MNIKPREREELLQKCFSYVGFSAFFRISGAYADWSDIGRGVKQGYVWSPWPFDLFMDRCMYGFKEYEVRLRNGKLSVKRLLDAGDQVPSACGLQAMIG